MNTVTIMVAGRPRQIGSPNAARRLMLADLSRGPLAMNEADYPLWWSLDNTRGHLTSTVMGAARLGLVDLSVGGGKGVAHLTPLGVEYRRATARPVIAASPVSPSPTQVGTARLAHLNADPGQARDQSGEGGARSAPDEGLRWASISLTGPGFARPPSQGRSRPRSLA